MSLPSDSQVKKLARYFSGTFEENVNLANFYLASSIIGSFEENKKVDLMFAEEMMNIIIEEIGR